MSTNGNMAVNRAMPDIDESLCNLCGDCVSNCPNGAASMTPEGIVLDGERCAYCGDCEDVCPAGAIALPFEITLSKRDDSRRMSDGPTEHCGD